MQDILIVVDYLRKQLGITAEYHCMDYPQTEEQFLNQLRWISGVDEHNSCLFTDDKLITWQQIQQHKDIAFSSFALDLLRVERNKLLADTDWWAVPDRTMTAQQTAYRQALRDLPENSTPTLNSRSELDKSSVTWPTKPV
jgi:hypothetical protein